jgi:hypothetical protein
MSDFYLGAWGLVRALPALLPNADRRWYGYGYGGFVYMFRCLPPSVEETLLLHYHTQTQTQTQTNNI